MLNPLIIPSSIIEYWYKSMSDQEKITTHYIDDVIYIDASLKTLPIETGKIYVNRPLGKLIYGNLYVYLRKGHYDRDWIPLKLFEKLIKLKAFW